MDRQLIKTLIDALQSSGLSELEYASGGESLRLVKGTAVPAAAARPAPVPVAVTPAAPPAPAAPLPAAADVVTAPLYGVLHLQPAPGAPPFVTPGQTVEAGAVLCTVEAMKVFTEVRAGRAGTVDAILAGNGQEVEPGQALVRLR